MPPWDLGQATVQRQQLISGTQPCGSVSLRSCGEEEVVIDVHTLIAGVVQVYHRLHVDEEEEKGRKVEQEVEREGQCEETAHVDMTMDEVNGTNILSQGACVCEDEDRDILPQGLFPLGLRVLDVFLSLCCMEEFGDGFVCVIFARLLTS